MSRRRTVVVGVLVALVLAAVGLNLSGTNLYVYLAVGSRDLVGAVAAGSTHLAVAEHVGVDEEATGEEITGMWKRDLVTVGPLEVFAERGGGVRLFSFRVIKPDQYLDYCGVEFPLLLWLVIPAALWWWGSRKALGR